jgi:methyl-accepting chemotaxis protein
MRSSSADVTTATAEGEQSAGFANLRKRLAAPGQVAIINHVADVAAELEAAHAHDAAKRLCQIDDYALAMPPEAIPNLVDSPSVLDEIEDAKGQRCATSILWRNLLALAPLLITWLSLSLATSAYHAEVARRPDSIYQPFLALWESGFGVGFWPTFSAVAFWDAILFAGIIGLTWRIHSLERSGQQEARQLVARMDGAVVALVAVLGEEHMTGLNHPGEWAAAVKRVIDSALKETRELNKANEQALKAAQEAIRTAEQRHEELVRRLGGEILATLQAVRAQSEQTTSAVGTEAREMFAQAAAAHQQLAESSLQAVRQVGDQSRQYIAELKQETVETLRDLHEEDRKFLLASAQRADDLTRNHLMPTVETFRDIVLEFRTDLEQYQQGAKDLVGSVTRIREVAERLGETVQAFSTAAQSIQTQLQTVAQTQGQYATHIRSAADEMRTATTDMGASAAKVNDLLTTISGQVSPRILLLAEQMDRASTSLANTQQELQTELAKVSSGLSQTVEALNNLPQQKPIFPFFGRRP